MLRYLYKNYLIQRFVNTNNIDYTRIIYDEFFSNTEAVLNEIGDFLNYDFSRLFVDFGKKEIHVPTGDVGTKQWLRRGSQEIRYDGSWKERLTEFQKAVLDVVLKYLPVKSID